MFASNVAATEPTLPSRSESSDFSPPESPGIAAQLQPNPVGPLATQKTEFQPGDSAENSVDSSVKSLAVASLPNTWQGSDGNSLAQPAVRKLAGQLGDDQPGDNGFVAAAKLPVDGASAIPQKSVSATLVVPEPKQVIDDRFFKDEPIQQPDTMVAKAKVVLSPALMPETGNAQSSGKTNSVSPAGNDAIEVAPPKNVALHGKCPITLLKKGVWVDGDPQWGCVHRDRTYLFASEADLRVFQKDPDANSPLLAGYDPVVFHNLGELVDGDEAHGVFMGKLPNQRVVLFSSAKTRAEFESNPKNYIETIRQAMQATGGSSSKLMR